ncbi:hypothetical protein VTJ49DRAFT_122 [Mycothermus thermophilus]|uniref:Nudix hydrolase domain-containing protein n=1 Tax=Humicola insolens TaxID=85995 RepID=A0ABR3VPJ0_HUMIN
MACSQSPDVSTSTLREVQTRSTPPYGSLSPPPRRHMESPEKRYLPPSPLKRNSGLLAFSQEADAALATPEPVMSPDEDSIFLMLRPDGPAENHHSDTDHATSKHVKRKKKRSNLRLCSTDGAQEPFDAPLSQQPKSSIYKMHQITGMQNRETTPTGHNSEKKIHKITGLGFAPERPKQINAEDKEPLHGEISSGSEYSNGGDSEYFNVDRFARRKSESSAIPSPLRIVKPPRPSRSLERPASCSPGYSRELTRSPLSPRFERFSFGYGRDALGIESAFELYHEAAKELARQDPLAAQQSKPDATLRLAAEMLLRPVSAPGIDERHSLWTSASQQETHRSLGARTLGGLPHRLRNRLSVSPSPSRDASQRRRGRNGNRDGIGTPETGGSIPISISSDISTPTTGVPDDSASPRRISRSSSLMAKVFRRSVTSPSSPAPPIGNTPSNTPVTPSRPAASFADHMRRSPHSHHDHVHQYPLSTTSTIAAAAAAAAATTTTTPTPASSPLIKEHEAPKSPINEHLSSLAANTTDLAAAAAGLLNKSATGLSNLAAGGEDKRRRKQLKTPAVSEEQPLAQAQEVVGVASRDPEALQTVIQGIQDEPQPLVDTALPPHKPHQDQEDSAIAESPEPEEEPESDSEFECSSYWHAAVARLRAYKPPPFPLWDRLPLSRRAAVLLLLYADRRGDLRVVITMRAASLRSFSGHAALPGGKADSLDETPYQIARREAYEEIGLPMDDSKLPPPFRIEHLCYLPMNLARTELVVRPCVALLHTGDGIAPSRSPGSSSSSSSPPPAQQQQQGQQSPPPAAQGTLSSPSPSPSPSPSSASASQTPTAEASFIPRLDAKEVAAVFSAPFHNFLRELDETPPTGAKALPPGKWYEGSWTEWNDHPWRMHFFYVPVNNQKVVRPKVSRATRLATLSSPTENGSPSATEEENGPDGDDGVTRYKVWGMTARILVDAATIAYGEPPEFEHNTHFGDEEIIEELAKIGRLEEKKRPGGALAAEDVKRTKEVIEEEKRARRKGEESKM